MEVTLEPITPEAPSYGLRTDGTPKGAGWLGELKRPDGKVSTEISIGVEFDGKQVEIPSLVPTLTQPEVDHLLAGNKPTKAIMDKAIAHALPRIREGKSPFKESAGTVELEPVPQPGLMDRAVSGVKDTLTKMSGVQPEADKTVLPAAAGVASGMTSWIPAGVSMFSGLTFKDPVEAAARAKRIQAAFTYTPKDPAAQKAVEIAASPITLMAEKGEEWGQAYDKKAQEAFDRGDKAKGEAWLALGLAARVGGEAAPFLIPGMKAPIKIAVKGVTKAMARPFRGMEGVIPEGNPVQQGPSIPKTQGEVTGASPETKVSPAAPEPGIAAPPIPEENPVFLGPDGKPAVPEGVGSESINYYVPPEKPKFHPALKVDGEVYKAGQNHGEVYSSVPTEKIEKAQDIQSGYVDDNGKWFTDEEARATLEPPKVEEPIPPAPLEEAKSGGSSPNGTEVTLEQLDPLVKGGAVKATPQYATGSSINLDKLDTTLDVKVFTDELTTRLEESIGKRKVTWEESRAQAEQLGWNVKDFQNAWRRKGSFSAAEIEAARQTNLNSIESLHEAIRSLPADRTQWGPEIRAKLLDTLDMVKVTSQASSEAGRALNIHRKALSNDPKFTETMNVNKILKVLSGQGIKRTDAVIEALKNVDFNDIAAVNKLVYNLTKTKWQKMSDGAFELYINGLLSNPVTHVVNTTSNAFTMAYTTPEHLLAAGVDAVRAKVTGTPREIFFRESAQDAFSISKGIVDGAKRFLLAMEKGDMRNKLDYPVSVLPEGVQKWTPTRALTAEDAFFKGFVENQTLNRLAVRIAAKEKLTGQALKDRVTELLENPSDHMLEQAAERGRYLTFQKDLGEVGNTVMRARDVVPGAKYFIPFVKTPTNIVKFSLERTPLAIPLVGKRLIKGELKGADASEATARVLMGSMIGVAVYQFAKQGFITGGMPKDKVERDEKMATGWQPYSFYNDGRYYSFARIEPFATIAGMAADFATIEHKMKEDDKYNIAAGIAGAISTNVTDKTFMTGMANAIDFVSDPAKNGPKIAQKMVGSLVPAVAGGVARSVDPYVRDVRNTLDTVQSRIPGQSDKLAPKLTVWGDPITRPGTAATRLVSPVQSSEDKGGKLEKELGRLKDVSVGYPSRKLDKVELTQDEYWGLVRNSGKLAKTVLVPIVESPQWEMMNDEVKGNVIKSVVSDCREAFTGQLRAKLLKEGRLKK